MKNSISKLFLSCILLFGISSCNNPCKDTICEQGKCEEGICICDAGFEGPTCDTRVVSKFIGNFNAAESCNSGSGTYVVQISEDLSQVSSLNIDNLYSSTLIVKASVSDSTLQIADQPFGNGQISGDGSISSSNVFTINFSVVNGPITDQCTVVLQKN